MTSRASAGDIVCKFRLMLTCPALPDIFQAAAAAARALLGLDDEDSPAADTGAAAPADKAAEAAPAAVDQKPSGKQASAANAEGPAKSDDAEASDDQEAAQADVATNHDASDEQQPEADERASAAEDGSSGGEESESEDSSESEGAEGGSGEGGKEAKPKRWDAPQSESSEEDEVKVSPEEAATGACDPAMLRCTLHSTRSIGQLIGFKLCITEGCCRMQKSCFCIPSA